MRVPFFFGKKGWGFTDALLTAKSLAAGLPLAGITGRAEIMDSPHVGGPGGAYGENPVACRSARAIFEMIERENLLEESKTIGDKVRSVFEQ